MIELELTPKIKAWLDTPAGQRDYAEGALLIGKISRNRILFANVSRNPEKKRDAITYHLEKIYRQRLVDITHSEVKEMMAQCDTIAAANNLDSTGSTKSDFQKGKRADHDELPDEIQNLWVRNGEIRQRMRDCHTHLRLINPQNSTCPDSDRYPWAKELIALDKEYRDNWNVYDHYVKGTAVAATAKASDPRTASKNAAKTANMLLGKYAAKPTEELADRIRAAYARVLQPTDNLTRKMREAKLL